MYPSIPPRIENHEFQIVEGQNAEFNHFSVFSAIRAFEFSVLSFENLEYVNFDMGVLESGWICISVFGFQESSIRGFGFVILTCNSLHKSCE